MNFKVPLRNFSLNIKHVELTSWNNFQSQQEVGDGKESRTVNVETTNDCEDSANGRSSPIPVVIKQYCADGADFYYT